jgi:hypothetical protein
MYSPWDRWRLTACSSKVEVSIHLVAAVSTIAMSSPTMSLPVSSTRTTLLLVLLSLISTWYVLSMFVQYAVDMANGIDLGRHELG